MKNTYKILIAVAVILVFIGVGVARTPSTPSVTSTVTIGYLPVVHALPLYYAIDKGYFDEANIKVELTRFEAPNQIIDALLSNQIDMSLAGATGITAVAESKKPGSLKIFAIAGGDKDHLADALIVHKDSEFKTISDLKGKKVGVLPGIQWKTISQHIFTQNNMDISKDVTLVELAVPLQVQTLASKQVDALLTVEPVITLAEAQGISKTLVESPNLLYTANPFYAGVGNVSVSFIEKESETFKKVLSILDRSTKEINTSTDEPRKSLPKYTPISEELSKTVRLPIYKMYSDITPTDEEAVQKFIDVFVKYKVIETPVSAHELIYRN